MNSPLFTTLNQMRAVSGIPFRVIPSETWYKPHPEQGFRACLGILRLVRSYGPERLEAACQRGVDIGARTYGSVQSILRNGLDRTFRFEPVPDELPVQHEHIRGSGYYH